jgi:CheY-like chemotaxis protein
VPFLRLSSSASFAQSDPAVRHVQGLLQKPYSRRDQYAALAALKCEEPDAPDQTRPEDAPARPGIEPGSEAPVPARLPRRLHVAPVPEDMQAAPKTAAEDPSEPEQAGNQADGPQQEPSNAAKSAPRLMRILAAEDNKTNQLVLRKMVKDLDIDLCFARNGFEVVEAFTEFKPDMIFMDISMPEMGGKEATEKIRALEREIGGHVPIIALTAHAMDGDSDGILESGLDLYMTKPLRKAAINEQVCTCCPDEVQPVLPVAEFA